MRVRARMLALGITLLISGGSMAGTANFAYRKTITIDNTKVMGITDHVNFPVLVSLTDPDLRTTGNGGNVESAQGDDIVFTAADGTTRLDFEIESYDQATGGLLAWVKVPLLQVASNTILYLYYGSTDIDRPQETTQSTWSESYVGVWHLGETGQGKRGEYRDSSPFANDGVGGNGIATHIPDRVPGKVGFGQYFDRAFFKGDATISSGTTTVTFANCQGCLPANVQGGDGLIIDPGGANEETFTVAARLSATQVSVTTAATLNHAAETYVIFDDDPDGDMINVGDDADLDQLGDQFTMEAWIQHDITPDFSEVFGILNHKGFSTGYRLVIANNSQKLRIEAPGSSSAVTAAATISPNVWHHVAATYDGATLRLYLDGVKDVNEVAKTGPLVDSPGLENDVWIGHGDQPLNKSWSYPWEGYLDEIRISRVARSTDWLATEFNNQNAPGTFYTVGSETPGAYSLATFDVNSRSIGTGGQIYATGTASVSLSSQTVSFAGATLPANIGIGDKLVLDPLGPNEETLFLLSRDGASQVTVQTRATSNHTSETFSIERAYGTLQSWEDDRDGDLVLDNRREIGWVYADSDLTGRLLIQGWTTDASHFVTVSVPPGQRHNGTAGTGAVLRPAVTGHPIHVKADFTRIEWLEITGWSGAGADGITIEADRTLYRNLLIHDGGSPTSDGIQLVENVGDFTATVENTIVYGVPRSCYRVDNVGGGHSLFLKLENVTAFNCGSAGGTAAGGVSVCENTGTESRVYARNVLSVGNSGADFVNEVSGSCLGTATWTIPDTNMSSDGTAPGPNSITGVTASSQFASTSLGSEDLHLTGGADAIDAGQVSFRFWTDIDNLSRLDGTLWDIGADELEATTAVSLVRFEASPTSGGVVLTWETASELDNLGFHLYRSTSPSSSYQRITPTLVSGLGSSPTGGSYRFYDQDVVPGKTYSYLLEDVETRGAATRHGPVSILVPESGTAEEPAPEAPPQWTFGEPESADLVVTRPRADTAVVVLETPGFSWYSGEDGPDLEVPGFDETVPPVRRLSLEALPGRGVDILSIEATNVLHFPHLDLDGGQPEAVSTTRGAVRLERRRRSASNGNASPAARAEWAKLTDVGYQGDVKKALLELRPLQWNEASGELLLARRLEVRLSFRKPVQEDRPDRRARTRNGHGPANGPRHVLARLATETPGLYRVSYEELFGRTRAPSELRLSRQGEPVPYRVVPEGGAFRPGTSLLFWSAGEKQNPFGRQAVYEVEGGEPVTMNVAKASVGAELEALRSLERREESRYYQAGLVTADDLWFWDLLPSGETKSYDLEVTDLFPTASDGALTVWLQGTSDLREDPDHHLRLSLNGVFLGESFFDGKIAKRIELPIPSGVLSEGRNELAIENAGDTGAAYSLVMLDKFEVSYLRRPVAREGRLRGQAPHDGRVSASGFASGALVVDTTDLEWVATESSPDGIIRFPVVAGHRYEATAPEAALHPVIRRSGRSGLGPSQRVDYLVIAPRELVTGIRPLTEWRRAQGLATRVVAVEDVYDELGFGEESPESIRRLVEIAYHEWEARYVLLVGDATYDFKDYLGLHQPNGIVPRIIKTSYLWTASDPSYGAVHGEDGLPDVAVGRLPAKNADELRAMVDKILDYEQGSSGLFDRVVLVADNPDRAGNFSRRADELAEGVLGGVRTERIFLGELGAASTRRAVVDALDGGVTLMSYLGHGGIQLWADESILDNAAVDELSPQSRRPLLLTMNCLNGYFHFPYFDSLAERLLKSEGRGALAAFSPSGLSLDSSAHRLQELLLAELLTRKHERLGDAVLKAEELYIDSGNLPELVTIYQLLGDPALALRR